MLYIQVKSGRDPRVLAELIASTQGKPVVDPKLVVEAQLLREVQEHAEHDRPSRDEVETVNFTKLDDANDWTDI